MTLKKKATSAEPVVAPVTGGATIADRFKLDMPDPNAKKPAGAETKIAVIAGVIALGVVGFLAFTLWQHWEYLMPA